MATLPPIIRNPPLHSGLILAVATGAVIYFFIAKTVLGFEFRTVGANPRASSVFGINVRLISLLALLLGGATAGLAGAIEVVGVHHRLIEGLQSNYLILGIIAGLISRGRHSIVPIVAFLIAVLEVGASAMQRTMMVPGEFVLIVEALILIFVLLAPVVRRKKL